MFKSWFSLRGVCALSLAATGCNGTVAVSEPQMQVPDIQAETREDILDAYRILAKHHPGMYNPFDPSFAEVLKNGRDEALLAVSEVRTSADRFLAINAINRALADGHAIVHVPFNGGAADWPGFYAEWRGDALYVTSNSEDGPIRGSKLLSCDGRPATDLIREEAFGFFGRPQEAGQWWQSAGTFFSRGDLSRTPVPETCRFQQPDGATESIVLHWEKRPRDEFMKRLASKERVPVGMSILPNGIRWITLSSFSPGPDDQASYDALLRDLETQGAQLREDRAIVLDLRDNGGGSSTWSRKVANALWGEAAVDWTLADYFRETEIWYLADQGNIDYLRPLAKTLRERGLVDIAIWAEETSELLAVSNDAGERFYKQPFGQELSAEAEPSVPRDLPPVYVITDGGCASACLDAVDTFAQFDNVTRVGAPTSGDTAYLEVRRQPLPSGRGSVILPMKIWINRPRGSGEVYHPDILVTDLDWTTETMLSHIERDLAGR